MPSACAGQLFFSQVQIQSSNVPRNFRALYDSICSQALQKRRLHPLSSTHHLTTSIKVNIKWFTSNTFSDIDPSFKDLEQEVIKPSTELLKQKAFQACTKGFSVLLPINHLDHNLHFHSLQGNISLQLFNSLKLFFSSQVYAIPYLTLDSALMWHGKYCFYYSFFYA